MKYSLKELQDCLDAQLLNLCKKQPAKKNDVFQFLLHCAKNNNNQQLKQNALTLVRELDLKYNSSHEFDFNIWSCAVEHTELLIKYTKTFFAAESVNELALKTAELKDAHLYRIWNTSYLLALSIILLAYQSSSSRSCHCKRLHIRLLQNCMLLERIVCIVIEQGVEGLSFSQETQDQFIVAVQCTLDDLECWKQVYHSKGKYVKSTQQPPDLKNDLLWQVLADLALVHLNQILPPAHSPEFEKQQRKKSILQRLVVHSAKSFSIKYPSLGSFSAINRKSSGSSTLNEQEKGGSSSSFQLGVGLAKRCSLDVPIFQATPQLLPSPPTLTTKLKLSWALKLSPDTKTIPNADLYNFMNSAFRKDDNESSWKLVSLQFNYMSEHPYPGTIVIKQSKSAEQFILQKVKRQWGALVKEFKSVLEQSETAHDVSSNIFSYKLDLRGSQASLNHKVDPPVITISTVSGYSISFKIPPVPSLTDNLGSDDESSKFKLEQSARQEASMYYEIIESCIKQANSV